MLQIARQVLKSSGKPVAVVRTLASSTQPQKTCLYDLNVRHQGKMVEFAGYLMPVQYGSEGIAASHNHTRSSCGLFDVSHMLQTHIHGKDGVKFLESLMVGDVEGLKADHGTLSVFTTPSGGIVDDFIVNKTSLGFLYVVSNAGCREKDLALLTENLALAKGKGLDVELEILEGRGLLAIQGPLMASILQPHVDISLDQLYFMTTSVATVCGVPNCRITRCGYTGEDGVEVSVPPEAASDIVDKLLTSSKGALKLAGLGARDSLRLEAGLCLYGSDMNESINPIEASLAWLVAKRRRALADFPGAANILQELKSPSARRRVGFISRGAPARGHTLIYSTEGQLIGEVTSGCPSPSLPGFNVSMGYVDRPFAKIGTQVQFDIRKKRVEAQVSKMPFVPTKYYLKK
nr:EOG090X057R [Eurycercus lamellatus]